MAWLVDRIRAISAINSVRGLGYSDAKNVYEKINSIMTYQYMSDENINKIQEVYNLGYDFKTHLNFLKHDKIIQFEDPNTKEDKEYELEQLLKEEELKEAIVWMESLSKSEQEMINRIVEANRLFAFA